MVSQDNAQEVLDRAVEAISTDTDWGAVLDTLPAPIYVTDPDGKVTYWNSACVSFAGREPELDQDRWCVSWHLYTTTGEPLADSTCPVAQALKNKRPIRDVITVGERPDGSRVAFKTYPTPMFNDDGTLKGCVNMLVDVTEEQTHVLHEQADRCRRLADVTYDRDTSKVLGDMAAGFDRTADELSRNRS